MKLEKREVTLNEADSLKDTFYMIKTLETAYREGAKNAERKEVSSELAALLKDVQNDGDFIKQRLEKSIARFSEIGKNDS